MWNPKNKKIQIYFSSFQTSFTTYRSKDEKKTNKANNSKNENDDVKKMQKKLHWRSLKMIITFKLWFLESSSCTCCMHACMMKLCDRNFVPIVCWHFSHNCPLSLYLPTFTIIAQMFNLGSSFRLERKTSLNDFLKSTTLKLMIICTYTQHYYVVVQ